MALTGVHVACCYAGREENKTPQSYPVVSEVVWSKTMTGTSGTTQDVPGSGRGDPLFEIDPAIDIFAAVGTSPDPVNGPCRFFSAAEGKQHWYCEVGDKLKWVQA